MKLIQDTIKVIRDADERSKFMEAVKFLLDSSVFDEVIGEIPFLSPLTNSGKFALSVRDHLFIKRLREVLYEVDKVDSKVIEDFTEQLTSVDKQERFGEHLISVVEQADSTSKAKIIGVLFRHTIEGKISRDNFELVSFAVAKAFIHDLYGMRIRSRTGISLSGEPFTNIDDRLGTSLGALGLVEACLRYEKPTRVEVSFEDDIKNGKLPKVKLFYKITRYGYYICDAIDEINPLDDLSGLGGDIEDVK